MHPAGRPVAAAQSTEHTDRKYDREQISTAQASQFKCASVIVSISCCAASWTTARACAPNQNDGEARGCLFCLPLTLSVFVRSRGYVVALDVISVCGFHLHSTLCSLLANLIYSQMPAHRTQTQTNRYGCVVVVAQCRCAAQLRQILGRKKTAVAIVIGSTPNRRR